MRNFESETTAFTGVAAVKGLERRASAGVSRPGTSINLKFPSFPRTTTRVAPGGNPSFHKAVICQRNWIPAFAGMTEI